MRRQAFKPRKKCNRCYSVNPPDSTRCSVCETAFVLPVAQVSSSHVVTSQESVNKSLALSSTDSNSEANFLFTADDIDLLFSLNNLSASKKEESKKICFHCRAENMMSASVCEKCEFTFNTMPFLVHPAERKGFKSAKQMYLSIISVLLLLASVGLIWVYLSK